MPRNEKASKNIILRENKIMIDIINQKMKFIEEITRQLGYALSKDDYFIEDMGGPHNQPKKMPNGYAAIYIFLYQNEFVKIGKANAKSNARFVSQHYGFSAPSTLAKSICSDEKFTSIGVGRDNVKSWMMENLHRINIYVKANKATTGLVEAVLHYAFRPRFEGTI